jgi:hypothetical protein
MPSAWSGERLRSVPGAAATDGWGFVHRTLIDGRTPLKTCRVCGSLVTREHWNLSAWCCKGCVGLG